jgi:hypothetical protein
VALTGATIFSVVQAPTVLRAVQAGTSSSAGLVAIDWTVARAMITCLVGLVMIVFVAAREMTEYPAALAVTDSMVMQVKILCGEGQAETFLVVVRETTR